MKVTCDYCGNEFEARRSDARFCCPAHRAKWHRDQNKINVRTTANAKNSPDLAALQDVISEGFERVVAKMAQSPADALIGTTSRGNDLQQEILDELRKMNRKIDALVSRPVSQPAPMSRVVSSDNDDLLDTLEIKEASSSGVNVAANLVNSLMALQGKKPKEDE